MYADHSSTPRRHETEDIAAALDVARNAWPELADKPGALLRQLISPVKRPSRRGGATQLRVVARPSNGRRHPYRVYGHGYLEEVRRDWARVIILDASILIAHLESGDSPPRSGDGHPPG